MKNKRKFTDYPFYHYDYIVKLNGEYIFQCTQHPEHKNWKHLTTSEEWDARLYKYIMAHKIKVYYEKLGVKVELLRVAF